MARGKVNGAMVRLGLALVALFVSCSVSTPAAARNGRGPVIFNFGDSNSDTGGYTAGTGTVFPLPYGRVFFHRFTGRICDGRLLIDFLCESLKTKYLSPYLEALGADFRNGANFAINGATVLLQLNNSADSLPLPIQVKQFLHFKSRSLDLLTNGHKDEGLVSREGFEEGLYMIDIGQNDLWYAFKANFTYAQVVAKIIPQVVAEIKLAIQALYSSGARRFWIHGTGPLGCLPERLAAAAARRASGDRDEHGCLKTLNAAASRFNSKLSILRDELSKQLENATVVYTDLFAIKYDLISNYAKYGFEKPVTACCGAGGLPYNFDPAMWCTFLGSQACADGSKYINWDGIHYTDAANAAISAKILTGNFSTMGIKFNSLFTH